MHFNKFYILALILCNMLFISCKKSDNEADSDGSSRPLTIAQIKDQNSLFDYVKGKADKDDLIDSAWKQFNSLEKPIGAAEFRDKLIKESSLPKYAITEDSRPGLYLLDKITSSIGIEDFKKEGCPADDNKKPDARAFGVLLSATALDSENRKKVIQCIDVDDNWLKAFAEWAGRNYILAAQGYFEEVYSNLGDSQKELLRNTLLQAMALELGPQAASFLKSNSDKFYRYGLATSRFAILFEGQNLAGNLDQIKQGMNNAVKNSDWYNVLLAQAGTIEETVNKQNKKIQKTPVFNGVVGLKNCGNTCYMNSIIQCFFQTPPMNKLLGTALDQAPMALTIHDRADTYFAALHKTFSEYKKADEATDISTKLIADARPKLSKEFEIGRQDDAEAISTKILETLNQEFLVAADEEADDLVWQIENKRYLQANFDIQKNIKFLTEGYSIIEKWFSFYFKEEIERDINRLNKKTIKFVPGNMLNIGIADQREAIALKNLLDKYFAPELMSDSEAISLGTKKFPGKKTISLETAPQYLRIALKRFNNAMQKISTPINFTEELTINTTKERVKYKLYATSNHSGSFGGGHYWGNVATSEGKWYNVNDSQVESRTIDQVLNTEKQSVYLLFYERQ